jgi:O-antigen ligase
MAVARKSTRFGLRGGILNRSSIAGGVLWIGLFAPAALNFEVRSRAGVLAGAVDPVSISRGAVPIACLVLAWVLTPVPIRPVTLIERLFLAYVGVVLLSTAWSVFPLATLLKAINLVTAYLLIMLLARVHQGRRNTLLELTPLLVLVLAFSLGGLLLAPRLAYKSISIYDPTRRLVGIFPVADPNSLGYIALVVLIAVLIAVLPRLLLRLPARVLVAGGAAAVLLLTRSRAPLVMLAGMLVFLADQLWRLKRRIIVGTGVAIVIIVAVALLLAPGAIGGFFTRGETANVFLGLTGRTTTWADAIQQWRHSPGIGYGYYAGHRVGISSHPGAPDVDTVDSTWIETLVDVGIIGLLPLVSAVIYGAVLAFRRWDESSDHLAITYRRVVVLVVLTASFISASFETPSYLMIIGSACLLGAPRLGVAPATESGSVKSSDTPG